MNTPHPSTQLISRIAPTPSGYLHSGNAFSFILTWLLVRRQNGKLVLRIDDSDSDRKRPEYVDDIFRTLDWLGLDYDAGPSGVDDFEKHFSQALRSDLYEDTLRTLQGRHHDLVFACSCSRKELAVQNSGRYPGTCARRGLPLDGRDTAWRILVPDRLQIPVPDVLDPAMLVRIGESPGSFVIRRRDGKSAYQVVSIVEDLALGTNFIVRGSDLAESSGMQIYLASLLGLSEFPHIRFLHHGLIRGADGAKLSKSAKSPPLALIGRDERARIVLLDEFSEWMGRGRGKFSTVQEILETIRTESWNDLILSLPHPPGQDDHSDS